MGLFMNKDNSEL